MYVDVKHITNLSVIDLAFHVLKAAHLKLKLGSIRISLLLFLLLCDGLNVAKLLTVNLDTSSENKSICVDEFDKADMCVFQAEEAEEAEENR
jgi:hypothetical protein